MKKLLVTFALLVPLMSATTQFMGCTQTTKVERDSTFIFDTVGVGTQVYGYFARAGLNDLSFLQNSTSLEKLWLDSNEFSDLTPLSHLTKLNLLSINSCYNVTDLSPLAGLDSLEQLFCFNCFGIKDITPISHLPNLMTLDLEGCWQITDVSSLANLTKLDSLSLHSANGVTDISVISTLKNLTWLDLGWANNIQDYSACSALTKLKWIRIAGMKATSISALSGLPLLQTILIANNALPSIVLSNLPKVHMIDFSMSDSVKSVALSNMDVI